MFLIEAFLIDHTECTVSTFLSWALKLGRGPLKTIVFFLLKSNFEFFKDLSFLRTVQKRPGTTSRHCLQILHTYSTAVEIMRKKGGGGRSMTL